MTQTETKCPQDVWFANQIPDFACASVALLNIVNNIKGLAMGKEMQDFKEFSKDLDPMARGDAIDGFDFLKRIHNSFARETDLLNADMHMRNKMMKAKKRQATMQAQATKKAKKTAETADRKRTDSAVASPKRNSNRMQRSTAKKSKPQVEIPDSDASSALSDPPDSDCEFTTKSTIKRTALQSSSSPAAEAPRRSGRQAKPRKDPTKLFSEAETDPDNEGFHYVAYLPVNGRVWKLDGLDSYPHLVGEFDAGIGGEWMGVASPEVQARLMMFEGVIEYNLMAVVHDPIVGAKTELAANVKELQTIDKKLDDVSEDWRDKAGLDAGTGDAVLGPDPAFDLEDADLTVAPHPTLLEKEIEIYRNGYLDELLKLRNERTIAQRPLRESVQRELRSSRDDDEMAKLRRHDFGSFVRGWLGGLAEQEVLKELVDDGETMS